MSRATTRFINEIKKSHRVFTKVTVIGPSQENQVLDITDGSITCDRTAQFRRSATMTCIDRLGVLVPDGQSGILMPIGTEVRPFRGVEYDDGTTETYPLGVFRLSKTTVAESSGVGSGGGTAGTVFTLEMFDRSRTVSRSQFANIYTVPAATNIITAIKLILGRTFANLDYDSISTNLTTTADLVFDAGNDPWEAVTSLAKSIGCEIYFNVDGWVVIAPPTDIDSQPQPAFTYIENQGCTMTDLSTVFSDEPGFNGVIVTGESVGDELPPVRAEAWDEEPTSPTYRKGPYGEVPTFVNDSNVKTAAAAQAMADSILRSNLGFTSQLNVTAWTNPTLEAGDVVEVERAALNVSGLYILDAFTIPLQASETQTLNVRQKRTAS